MDAPSFALFRPLSPSFLYPLEIFRIIFLLFDLSVIDISSSAFDTMTTHQAGEGERGGEGLPAPSLDPRRNSTHRTPINTTDNNNNNNNNNSCFFDRGM